MSVIRELLNWFTGKNDKEQVKELKKVIPETPPPKIQIKTIQDLKAATQINTFRDVKAFCKEVRKTLTIYKKSCGEMVDASWIHKKAIDSLYVEMDNLSKKVDRLIEGQKGGGDEEDR
ncbi:hypothetical protein ES702_03087 [subsurface metagenome]